MVDKIIVIDFSGTLIKPFVAEKANLIRYKLLGISSPSKDEHKKMHGTKEHYDILKKAIAEIYGINEDMKFGYVQNYGKEIELSGEDMQTIIMTDLFKICMYKIAKKYGRKIFVKNIGDILKTIKKKKKYKLAIVSGIRKDIITGILEITKFPVKFDYIYAQDPVLSKDDNKLLNEQLAKKGKIEYIIGDKMSDLKPARKIKAKSIFVTWGHSTGGEEKFADYIIKNSNELKKIIL